MDKQEQLIERIAAGWYDEKVETLLRNAEKEINVAVWKACNSRKDVAGTGSTRKLPSKALLKMTLPKHIRCSICAPVLRPYVAGIAALLQRCGLHCMDVGYRPAHIVASKYMGLDAVETRVGQWAHHVRFLAVAEAGTIFYVVVTHLTNDTENWEAFESEADAGKYFLQEVDDECVGKDL